MLLMEVLQNSRDTRRQIVVEQDGAGIKILQPQAVITANQGLDGDALASGQVVGRRLLDVGAQRTKAHIQTGLMKDTLELHHIGEVESVAGVVLRHHQQIACLRADLLNRGHRRLNRQGQHLGSQVVPTAGKQIGINRRELEARIADVYRAIKRRCVLHPFEAEPTLNGRGGVEHPLLKFIDGAVQSGNQVRNHAKTFGLGKGKLQKLGPMRKNAGAGLAVRCALRPDRAPRISNWSGPQCRPDRGRETYPSKCRSLPRGQIQSHRQNGCWR